LDRSGKSGPGHGLCRPAVVAAVLTSQGRALLGHRNNGPGWSAGTWPAGSWPAGTCEAGAWDLPGGRVEPGESPQAALQRHVEAQLGARVDVSDRAPDFQLRGEGYDLRLWVVRTWQGEVANCVPGQVGALGWFAADELGSVEMADALYLGVLSTVLNGGRSRLTWSQDGTTVTKTLVPGIVIPHWASLLGTPRQAALNELRVNRLLARVPPPVPAPRLVSSSRRGPSMTFEAVHGAPLGPKFPDSVSAAELDKLARLALALDAYQPRRRWFRRLYVSHRLAVHCRSGVLGQTDAAGLAAFAERSGIKWRFAHGDITARNVLRDAEGRLALIDWEWAGLYPLGYDFAFLWFSLAGVPGGRARVEALLPARYEAGFLLSAVLVHLLHLQMWLRTPNPFTVKHEQTLQELMRAVRARST
jgi:8-oxo-dGTP diphosphatase